MKYTIIYHQPTGFRLGQYFTKMKRIKTKDLAAYLEKHDIDVAFIFEGWPKLEDTK